MHVLNALDLRLTETTLVGDVVDSAGRLGVLAVDTARLDLVLVADLFEIGVRRGVRDFDVDACAHARAEVGRTRAEITKILGVLKSEAIAELVDGLRQTRKDGTHVASLLHGDDAKLVLFVDPYKEGFVVVVEDAATFGPFSVDAGGFKEAVTFLEEEVIVDELLSGLVVHSGQGVVLSSEVSSKALQNFDDFLLDFETLFLGERRGEAITFEVSGHTDAGGNDVLGVRVGVWSIKMGRVEVSGMTVSDLQMSAQKLC